MPWNCSRWEQTRFIQWWSLAITVFLLPVFLSCISVPALKHGAGGLN